MKNAELRIFGKPESSRRNFLRLIGIAGTTLILPVGIKMSQADTSESKPAPPKKEEEISAVEDLMREHGILRRALFVYSEAVIRLRSDPSSVSPDALEKTAKLFRAFGEEYHEKKLEEAYIFPAVKKAGREAALYPDILVAQHQRGREITDYILVTTKGAKLDSNNAEPLARALESLVRMYRPHAAREDTIVFPAWKQILTAKELDEMNEKFEDIEHQMFGEDGFEEAVRQIGDIEGELGLTDLAQFTAPHPLGPREK